MSASELVGCESHDIRVSPVARDAWVGLPWSAEKNVLRRLCNEGLTIPFCPAPEIDLQYEPTLQNDPNWASANKLPKCLNGYHYPPPAADEPSLLVVGFWVVLFDDAGAADRSLQGYASLRNSYVRDIVFLWEIVQSALGLRP